MSERPVIITAELRGIVNKDGYGDEPFITIVGTRWAVNGLCRHFFWTGFADTQAEAFQQAAAKAEEFKHQSCTVFGCARNPAGGK